MQGTTAALLYGDILSEANEPLETEQTGPHFNAWKT